MSNMTEEMALKVIATEFNVCCHEHAAMMIGEMVFKSGDAMGAAFNDRRTILGVALGQPKQVLSDGAGGYRKALETFAYCMANVVYAATVVYRAQQLGIDVDRIAREFAGLPEAARKMERCP